MEMLNSKKGFYASARDWISFFIGIVLAVFGLIPLLYQFFKITVLNLHTFVDKLPLQILVWVVAIGGAYVILDGLIEPAGHMLHVTLMILGLVFVVAGLIPILISFKVLSFSWPLTTIVYQVIITIEAFMLMTAGLTMR